jgi:hypothetical protein
MCAIEQCAPWDVVHDTQPRAHQAHQCTECSRTSLYDELLEHWRDGFRSAGLFRLIVGMRRRWHDGRDPVPTGVGALARQMLGQVAA